MKIERVSRKDEKNVSVFFDNGERLILSEDTFYSSGLRKGDDIPEDRFSFLLNKIFFIILNREHYLFLQEDFILKKNY